MSNVTCPSLEAFSSLGNITNFPITPNADNAGVGVRGTVPHAVCLKLMLIAIRGPYWLHG